MPGSGPVTNDVLTTSDVCPPHNHLHSAVWLQHLEVSEHLLKSGPVKHVMGIHTNSCVTLASFDISGGMASTLPLTVQIPSQPLKKRWCPALELNPGVYPNYRPKISEGV